VCAKRARVISALNSVQRQRKVFCSVFSREREREKTNSCHKTNIPLARRNNTLIGRMKNKKTRTCVSIRPKRFSNTTGYGLYYNILNVITAMTGGTYDALSETGRRQPTTATAKNQTFDDFSHTSHAT